MEEKLVGTVTIEMNKYIFSCNYGEDTTEWIGYRESDKSVIKRIADTFGFDPKRIKLVADASDYDGGLYKSGDIEVCGFNYNVDLEKNAIFKW